METLYVIDASGWLYRSYFAIPHMTNPKGESTNALYGFIRSIHKLINDFSPHHIVAVFDGPKSIEKRKQLYPEYKAHRAKMPPDLRDQISEAQKFCSLFGLGTLAVEGVEADDTMGSLAVWAKQHGWKTYLCSSDKDLGQLVNDQVYLLNTHKENLILDLKGVENQFGVPPSLMVDYLAICGDSSDNVPGLPGFGPKTAAFLLQEFKSLDALLENPEKVAGQKKQETIRLHKETALLSRKLVTIDTSVPIPQDPPFYDLKKTDLAPLKAFYTDMHFLSLLKELDEMGAKEEKHTYHLIQTEKELSQLIDHLQKYPEICVDTETTALHPLQAKLVGIGLGVSPQEAWYIPFNGKISKEICRQECDRLFSHPQCSFYGHNIKYDLHILAQAGFSPLPLCFDTLLASYLLNAHSRRHSLDLLALEYFGKKKIPIEDLIGKGKKEISMADVPIQHVAEYCCEDVDYTIRLKQLLSQKLQERNLTELLENIELPLLPVLMSMEKNGIYVDPSVLKNLSLQLKQEQSKLEREIFEMAEETFNLNSPKQISEVLFGKFGIQPPKKTATGLSTSAEVLESLSEEYPIAQKILEYRMREKLRSTYIDTLPEQINPETKRIHCTFNQSVAATGRLSSQDPNLQNIPVRTKLGKEIRAAFRPQKVGWVYVSGDYSQMELRLLAHLSYDPALEQAFHEGLDVHAYTAATVWGIPLDQVTPEQRQHAKAVNFGMVYGQQAFGLARELHIDRKTAQDFIDLYFSRYKKVKEFLELCKEKARETGRAVTLFGRERLLPEIHSKNGQIRQAAERLAINTPIQGTAADLIKLAMLRIQKRIREENLQGLLLLQIHDELLFEIPEAEVDAFSSLIKKEMENVLPLRVPMTVDLVVGKNWKEC